MELEELQALWQKLDSKLDNLGKINKKMIFESVTKDRQKKLTRERNQYLAGIVIGPLGLTVIFLGRIASFDWKILVGILFTGFYMSYSIFMCIKTILALKSIDLNNDSILESVKKINFFKRASNAWLKYNFILWPLYFIGMLLVFWDLFIIDYKTIMFFITVFIVTLFFQRRSYKTK